MHVTLVDYLDLSLSVTTAAEDGENHRQLPNAAAEYDKLLESDPTNIDAATGAAYLAMLRGDYTQVMHPKRFKIFLKPQPEILMRRSLIAQQSQRNDQAKKFALESGLDAGEIACL